MIAVPETGQSGQQDVEFRVRSADDGVHRGHVTKNHSREALHVGESQVLNAAESQEKNASETETTDVIKKKKRSNSYLQLYAGDQIEPSQASVSLSDRALVQLDLQLIVSRLQIIS